MLLANSAINLSAATFTAHYLWAMSLLLVDVNLSFKNKLCVQHYVIMAAIKF